MRFIFLLMCLCIVSCGRPIDQQLDRAAQDGNVSEIKRLVANGADVNANVMEDAMPLKGAVINGHVDALKVLVELGANVNLGDSRNNTPLCWAAVFSRYDIGAVLVKAGANPRIPNSMGKTAISEAADRGDSKMLAILGGHAN